MQKHFFYIILNSAPASRRTVLLLAGGFLILNLFCFSQTQNIDSLWKVYSNKLQADTDRLKAINAIAWSYCNNKPDSAIALAEQQMQLAEKTGKIIYKAKAYNTIGLSCYNKGNYPKALENYLRSLKIAEQEGNLKAAGSSYNNIGMVYKAQNDYPKALDYYSRSLKIKEEIGDKKSVGSCYINIGSLYLYRYDYPKALECQLKALSIFIELNDKIGAGICYGNLASIYAEQAKPDRKKALEYLYKALRNTRETGDLKLRGFCYRSLGELYSRMKDMDRAIIYGDSALRVAKETNDLDNMRLSSQNLASFYFKKGKYKQAYEYHLQFKALTDSIFSEENSKQLGDLKTRFEVEKKESELKAKADAKEIVALVEKKRQQSVIYSIIGLFVLVLVFALFMFNRFRVTQKQKNIIEKQKELVEEKQKEILDSIHYAKRIQTALMPTEIYIEKNLKKLLRSR